MFALVISLAAVSCGDDIDAVDTASPTTIAEAGEPADTATLCKMWAELSVDDDAGAEEENEEELFAELARVVPASMSDDVARALAFSQRDRTARARGDAALDPVGDDLSALNEVMGWLQTECTAGRLVAPPMAAIPEGLTVCGAAAFPFDLIDDQADDELAVVYAPSDADDPYAGAVLMLTWGSQGHGGDGDSTPVRLRQAQGVTDAVVAPITAFQQVVLPDLGSVVAWTEDGQSFGLYGRGWDLSRSDELVAIAESVQRTGDGATESYSIPAGALPNGFGEHVAGSAAGASPLAVGAYSVYYRPVGTYDRTPQDGARDQPQAIGNIESSSTDSISMVTISGSPSQPGTEELWRVFALESERIEVDGRTVSISDAAWSTEGPVVATWRVGDSHVTVTGIDVDRQVVLDLIAASRDLTDEEWRELTSLNPRC